MNKRQGPPSDLTASRDTLTVVDSFSFLSSEYDLPDQFGKFRLVHKTPQAAATVLTLPLTPQNQSVALPVTVTCVFCQLSAP